jgi:hypothetical protein
VRSPNQPETVCVKAAVSTFLPQSGSLVISSSAFPRIGQTPIRVSAYLRYHSSSGPPRLSIEALQSSQIGQGVPGPIARQNDQQGH